MQGLYETQKPRTLHYTAHMASNGVLYVRVGEVDLLELVLLDFEGAIQDLVGLVRTDLQALIIDSF